MANAVKSLSPQKTLYLQEYCCYSKFQVGPYFDCLYRRNLLETKVVMVACPHDIVHLRIIILL